MRQKTIKDTILIEGIGLHSGKKVLMKLTPLEPNKGIVFKRTDISGNNNIIKADYKNVKFTTLCTEIDNGNGIKISTIEHLMSALYGLGIDNILIEIDSAEVPILDGSSHLFANKILEVGIQYSTEAKSVLRILKTVEVKDNNWSIKIIPSDNFIVNMTVDFHHKLIGLQNFSYIHNYNNYITEISKARTFGFLKDCEKLKSLGLGLGANENNTIILDENDLYKSCYLRYKDEFVRHKILDLCGDLYLSGYTIKGEVTAVKTGHKANNLLLREIFKDPSNYILYENNNNVYVDYSYNLSSKVVNY